MRAHTLFHAAAILAMATLISACGPEIVTVEKSVETIVLVCLDEAHTKVEPGQACPAEKVPAVEEADPCDLELRTYSESGNFINVPVGAAPTIRFVSTVGRLWSDTSSWPTSIVEISSRQGCGAVDILGVGVLVRRKDGASIPKHASGRLSELNMPSANAVYRTGTGWYETTDTDAAAPILGVTWDSSGWAKGVGTTEFAETELGPHDILSFGLNVADLQDAPIGSYEVSVSLRWRDVKTGVEVFYADLDHAVFEVEVIAAP